MNAGVELGPHERRLVVATLGDSITAGTPGWDPDAKVRAVTGATDPESQYQFWAQRHHPHLTFRNHGVNRERTDQIATRLDTAADGADVVVLQGGINDIVQGLDVDRVGAVIESTLKRALALRIRVVVADLLPWNNGWPDADARIRALNVRVHEIAGSHGVGVLPFHDVLEDPQRPGRMRDEWTSDGNHPSVMGYRRLGEFAVALRPQSAG